MLRDRKVDFTALCALKGGPLGRCGRLTTYPEPTSLVTLTRNRLFHILTLTPKARPAIRGVFRRGCRFGGMLFVVVVSEPTRGERTPTMAEYMILLFDDEAAWAAAPQSEFDRM